MDSGPNWYKAHSVLGGAPGVSSTARIVWIYGTSPIPAVATEACVYLDFEGPEGISPTGMLSNLLIRSVRIWARCNKAHNIASAQDEYLPGHCIV